MKIEVLLQAFERRNSRALHIGVELSAAGCAVRRHLGRALFGIEQVRLSLPNQHNGSPWGRALAQLIRAGIAPEKYRLKLAADYRLAGLGWTIPLPSLTVRNWLAFTLVKRSIFC